VRSVDEFQFLSGAVEGLARLRALGFGLVVVTNQRGIARGFMTPEDLDEVHAFMKCELARNGVQLDGIYVCPHEVSEDCPCRKPKPGLILTAARELEVDPARSYMVGDSASDVEAGKRAGARTVRIGREDESGADMVFPSLLDFAVFMETHDGGKRDPRPCARETKGAE
jgi:histidinol-phosphate phosphatase family protein